MLLYSRLIHLCLWCSVFYKIKGIKRQGQDRDPSGATERKARKLDQTYVFIELSCLFVCLVFLMSLVF